MENLQKRQTKLQKRQTIKKRQMKPVSNAIPNLQQRYRIFKEIDYPYMMRNVEVQKDEDDRLVEAIQKAFEIPSKTPEQIADKALLKAQYSGKSYPIYTDDEIFDMIERKNYLEPLFDEYGSFGSFDSHGSGGVYFRKESMETPYDVFFRSEPVEVPTVSTHNMSPEDRIDALVDKMDSVISLNSVQKKQDFSTQTSRPYTRKGRPPKRDLFDVNDTNDNQTAKVNIAKVVGKYVKALPVRKDFIEKQRVSAEKRQNLIKEVFLRNLQRLREDREKQTQLLSLNGSPKRIESQFIVYDAKRNSPAIERQSLLFDTD